MSKADYSRSFGYQPATFSSFERTVKSSIDNFILDNKVIGSLEKRTLRIENYHALLISIFHQVFNSSGSFALAGSMCNPSQIAAREYLFHHAEEEMTHWQWILEDLKSTGYSGKDPRDLEPKIDTTAYLSYGYYLALKFPIGRLAMALVLEGISGSFGLKYGELVLQQLQLKKEQAKFYLAHGELDQGHQKDIFSILSHSKLNDDETGQLAQVAINTVTLYKRIYNSSIE